MGGWTSNLVAQPEEFKERRVREDLWREERSQPDLSDLIQNLPGPLQ